MRSHITLDLVATTTAAPVNLAETRLAAAISAVVPIPEQPWLVVPDMRLAQERSGLLGQAVMQVGSAQELAHPLLQADRQPRRQVEGQPAVALLDLVQVAATDIAPSEREPEQMAAALLVAALRLVQAPGHVLAG